MGEHFVMAELLARHFNVARAVVDEGIDIIAFKPSNPQKLFRLQVKTALPKPGPGTTQKFIFTLNRTAYDKNAGQEYYLVLVMRDGKQNSFRTLVIPKVIFDDYVADRHIIVWDSTKETWQISVHLHDDGNVTLKNIGGEDVTKYTKDRWDRIG